MDTSLKNYSSGMQARLGFALAVNLDPDILLVDEILAVGDEAFQRKCMARMEQFRSAGKTIVFVSHSPEDVRRICDRACVLDFGSMVFLGKDRRGYRPIPCAVGRGVMRIWSVYTFSSICAIN